MKREQGKHLGWMKIKSDILKAIIEGFDTRKKLKDLFTPNIVSTKDIDYHLRGTERKPGLIKDGILTEKNGILALHLQTIDQLEDIFTQYLLSFPEFRSALDLEFSACYLSEYGDYLLIQDLSPETYKTMLQYQGWAAGKYHDVERERIEQKFMQLAEKKASERRGVLNDRNKIDYIFEFYGNMVSVTRMNDPGASLDLHELYGRYPISMFTLALRDINRISQSIREPENVNSYSAKIIKNVFDRLCLIAFHHNDIGEFIGAKVPAPQIHYAANVMLMAKYKRITDIETAPPLAEEIAIRSTLSEEFRDATSHAERFFKRGFYDNE